MEMQQLDAFTLLVQYENMSTVSHIMNTSQPQISKLLSSLEAELGVQLFDRIGRRIRLNEHGLLFSRYATNALANMQSAISAIKGVKNELLGTVKIGIFTFAPALHPCIQAYLQQEPFVNFSYTGATLDTVIKQNIDLIFTMSQEGRYKAQSHFPNCCKLFDEEYCVVISPKFRGYPAEQSSIDIWETVEFPYIVTSINHPYRSEGSEINQVLDGLSGFNPRIKFEVMNLLEKVLLVSEGEGVAFLPDICVPFAKKIDSTLRFFSIRNLSTARSIILASQKQEVMSPIAKSFWGFAVDYFSSAPADE